MTIQITNKKARTREQNIRHLVWRFADVLLSAHQKIQDNETELKVYDNNYTKTIKGSDWVDVSAIYHEVQYLLGKNDLLKLLLNRLTDEELQQLSLHREIENLSITDEA
jgi:hypothetical protein